MTVGHATVRMRLPGQAPGQVAQVISPAAPPDRVSPFPIISGVFAVIVWEW